MANEFRGRAGHSAECFGDTRNHWWHVDFLELMAKRLKLEAVRDVLDVGCGVGHWSMLLGAVLPEDARVTGIDREASWVEHARARADARRLAERFTYRTGDAEQLPFPDAAFDLVTCQTLLIHLPDPAACIREMRRVTRPGGLVLAAEPNNLTEALLLDAVTNQASTDDIVELVRLQLTCERGKVALGEGDNSLGDRVPGLFAREGLSEVRVFVNDRATAVFPPYDRPEQRALLEEARDRDQRGFWNWNAEDTRRYFLAGGGLEGIFTQHFARALAARQRIVAGYDDGTYHGTHGGSFFLVSGRR